MIVIVIILILIGLLIPAVGAVRLRAQHLKLILEFTRPAILSCMNQEVPLGMHTVEAWFARCGLSLTSPLIKILTTMVM
jgi:hypothetical protein